MSQNHLNYMNGVPVKIAESYKPPKKLALNQSVAQRLANSSNVTTQLLASSTYDFSLERTVLTKMSEWQHVRERENCDRKERLRAYQKERQQQLEARQKQMLTAVSYPSTDDLSSDDDEDDSGRGTLSDASKSAVSMKPVSIPTVPKTTQQQFSPPNCFDNILVPTIAPGHMRKGSNGSKMHTKINLQEFENDTSSPFDNIELKTINDLDILTEVWNSSLRNSIDDKSPTQTPTNETASASIGTIETSTQSVAPVTPETTYKHSTAMTSNSTIPTSNIFHHTNQMNYFNSNFSNSPSYAIIPNQYAASNYFNPMYSEHTVGIAMPSYTPINNAIYNDRTVIATNEGGEAKYESKSVPDIIQEINTELQNSHKARVNYNNQDGENKVATASCRIVSQTVAPNPVFRQLSISSQNLAKTISSMGFPLERVARVTDKLGKDDKKIIEHLILLSELSDLGSEERKISDALLKFDNNKEKALDFLIS